MWTWAQPVALVNARVVTPDGVAPSLRFGARVLSIADRPRRGDTIVDLDGAFVLPGLINAHDHLELNHYGLLKRRERYENAAAWIGDLRPALDGDDGIRTGRAHPLKYRLFIGALKNLLSGVTTVAHHNPLYREIGRRFPIRVVRRYGWAHSFTLERQPVGARGEPGGEVSGRCLDTPPDVPFMVHAGEGVDLAAIEELTRLDSLDCLRPNTVVVHGTSITPAQWERLLDRGASLVWCPASNRFLFGRTAPVRALLAARPEAWRHICLGSDSRISGSRDLLDELRVAREEGVGAAALARMVTDVPARILRLTDAGRIVAGAPADLVVLRSQEKTLGEALLGASRSTLTLVTIAGRPVVGCPSLSAVFVARHVAAAPVSVDGAERLMSCRLTRALARCPIAEPGVETLS
jgi:cytosine/adenosine deaminase-related metal-dependent hydrolase